MIENYVEGAFQLSLLSSLWSVKTPTTAEAIVCSKAIAWRRVNYKSTALIGDEQRT